jgi:chemotaxis protein methyltransferase CheR
VGLGIRTNASTKYRRVRATLARNAIAGMPAMSRDAQQQQTVARAPVNGKRQNSMERQLMAMAREPLLILDRNLRLVDASRSYYKMFPAKFAPAAHANLFCEQDSPGWSSAAFAQLRDVIAHHAALEDFETELDVPGKGPRRMLLSARPISDAENPDAAILVGLQDITTRLEAERLKSELRQRQETLLHEVHHRVANSLQIIASILLLKARSVQSVETRNHLHDVHKRLILVATVQRQLCESDAADELEFGPYLSQLCEGLAHSMVAEDNAVAIVSSSTAGAIKSDCAVSFGLIIAELVINALKHGFPDGRKGRIAVDFAASGPDWRLSVSDDGVGRPHNPAAPHRIGLGTNIVDALAHQLKATVEIVTSGPGSSTVITHAG